MGMSSHAAKLDQDSCVLTSMAFTCVCHGDSGSVGASLCFAGYSQKNSFGGPVSKGRQFGEEDCVTGFFERERVTPRKSRQPALVKPGHRCSSELHSLAWFESSPSLPGRVLFGRRETE